eukprot:TRINITY_DN36892_c0_g1_i1.p1 TRINITY_DN36892_c0_g1~~TRINITY_DN36892_c0_g1_i1.p1  ORF type:complete len:279 (-),score=37.50 TRINITY_DN36892_c0_g1_i1:88-924(-)
MSAYPYQHLPSEASEPVAPEVPQPVSFPDAPTPNQPAYIIVNYAPMQGQYIPMGMPQPQSPVVHSFQVEEVRETGARTAYILGFLGCLVCFPLSICGLAMARRAQRTIGNNPAHPDYHVARKAANCNRFVLAFWLATALILAISTGVYFATAPSYSDGDVNYQGTCDPSQSGNQWMATINYRQFSFSTMMILQDTGSSSAEMDTETQWTLTTSTPLTLTVMPGDYIQFQLYNTLTGLTSSFGYYPEEFFEKTLVNVVPGWTSTTMSFSRFQSDCTDFP